METKKIADHVQLKNFGGPPVEESKTTVVALQNLAPPPLTLTQKTAKWLNLTSNTTLEGLKEQFRDKPIFTEFAKVIHVYVQALLPNALTSLLLQLPAFGRSMVYYRLSSGLTGPGFVYSARQIDAHTNAWNRFVESDEVKKASQIYAWVSSNLCATLGESLSKALNVEKLVLIACKKTCEKPSNPELKKRLLARAVISLKNSLSIAKKQRSLPSEGIDPMLSCLLFWEEQGKKPKAFPAPSEFASGEFYQALQKSKSAYIEELAEALIKKLIPEKWRSGFVTAVNEGILPLAYDLEGHQALLKLVKTLIGGCAIELLADPMQVVINTLFVFALPTADLEPDGFGQGKREEILKTGSEMMLAYLKNIGREQILAPFKDRGFKQGPCLKDEVGQKKAAKQELKNLLKKLIEDQTNTEGRSLLNSFIYIFKNSGISDALVNNFLDGALQLLFDPNWPFIIYSLVEDLVDELKMEKSDMDEDIAKADIKSVMVHLYEELIERNSTLQMITGLTSVKEGIINTLTDKCHAGFTVSGPRIWQEDLLSSVTPTVQEVILSLKVLNAFRERGVFFEGDAKFFEIFVRETISQIVLEGGYQTPDVISAKRSETVRKLLDYKVDQLICFLRREEGDFVVVATSPISFEKKNN